MTHTHKLSGWREGSSGGGSRKAASCTRLHYAISGNVVWHSIQLSEFNFLRRKFSSAGHAPPPHLPHQCTRDTSRPTAFRKSMYVQLLIVSICAHQSCRFDDVWLFTRVPYRIVSVCVCLSVYVCLCVLEHLLCVCIQVSTYIYQHFDCKMPRLRLIENGFSFALSLTLSPLFSALNLNIFLVFHQFSCSTFLTPPTF